MRNDDIFFTDEIKTYPHDDNLMAAIDRNGKNFICDCMGGYLVKRSSSRGRPMISFVCKNITSSKINEIRSRGDMLTRKSAFSILHREDPAVEFSDDVVVFNYCSNGELSLRQYCQNLKAKSKHISADSAMTSLVKLLICYKESQGRNPYEALNCLSMDTIFVRDQELVLLPILPIGNMYPEEAASEVKNENGDPPGLDSDILSCAVLAVKIASYGDLKNPDRKMSPIIRDCLNHIRSLRPGLRDLEREFLSASNERTSSSIPRQDPPSHRDHENVNHSTRHTNNTPAGSSPQPPSHEGGNGIFSGFINTVSAFVNHAKFDSKDSDPDDSTLDPDDGYDSPWQEEVPLSSLSAHENESPNRLGYNFRDGFKSSMDDIRSKFKTKTRSKAEAEPVDPFDPFNRNKKR